MLDILMKWEIWKDIPGTEGCFQISNRGRVKSIDRVLKRGTNEVEIKLQGKILGGWISQYKKNSAKIHGKSTEFQLHRMLAQVFIPNPENKKCINHKNGDKLDNRLENLEWCTHAENNKHAYDIGLKQPPRGNAVVQYTKTGELIGEYKSLSEAARKTGIIRSNIGRHIAGRRPFAGGFLWKYKENDDRVKWNGTKSAERTFEV